MIYLFFLHNLMRKTTNQTSKLYLTIEVGRSCLMKIHLGVIVQQPLRQYKPLCWAYSRLTSILFPADGKICIQNCCISWKLEMEEHRLLIAGARPHDR